MRSLHNIQKALDQFDSIHLAKKELEICDELENMLNHEELLWRQKARCDWLQLEDQNKKFIHNQTVQRRKFIYIMTLRLGNDEWCFDQEILKTEAVRFFEKLYVKIQHNMGDLLKNIFPRLISSESAFLEEWVTNEEIKRALFEMTSLKSPRSDGFRAHFFQSQWDKLIMMFVSG